MSLSVIVAKLASKKFLMAVGTVVALVQTRQYELAVGVALGYLGVEGGLDLKGLQGLQARVDLVQEGVTQGAELADLAEGEQIPVESFDAPPVP